MALPDMVGLVVKDMAATLAFYRLLGLDIPAASDGEVHVEVITPNGYRLAWDTETMTKELYPEWKGGSGNIALAFKCDSPADVDALFAKVVAEGYNHKREPFDAIWEQRYAVVYDPDGNPIDLFAPLG